MGLDTTHGCWCGSYSAFMRWRSELVRQAWGVDIDTLPGYDEQTCNSYWPSGAESDALFPLIDHSDCDGKLPWEICAPLADRLEQILASSLDKGLGGHIGSFHEKTKMFIAGLRLAAENRENVEFF